MLRRPASTLPPHATTKRGCSSAGRALQSHCRGHRFDPGQLHCSIGHEHRSRCDKSQAQFSPTKFCPPLFGRTQSSNDGARGSSGETVARNLNATSILVAFSISVPAFPPVLPRPRRANVRQGPECPPEVRRIRRAGSGLPPSRPSRSSLRPRATRATRRSA
jgi:hypothetical protein